MPDKPEFDRAIIKQITLHEGVRLKPYDDATGNELRSGHELVGKLTIGVGRNLTDVGVTREEAGFLLGNDIALVKALLLVHAPWYTALSDVRRAVLIDMCFNMGWQRLSTFVDMLDAVKRGFYETAAEAMLDSTWAQQVGARATRLSLMMRTGTWPNEILTDTVST